MEEIVKGPIIVCPPFRCKMRLVLDKKSRVFIVVLKFDNRKVVLPHERRKLPVEFVASGPRNTRVIVKIAA